jgi:outer membrane receptor protein involved in Fe transport
MNRTHSISAISTDSQLSRVEPGLPDPDNSISAAILRVHKRLAVKRPAGLLMLIITCVFSGLLASAHLLAQTSSTGALTVTARDSNGQAIVGATVKASGASGSTRSGATDSAGTYTFGLLPPGNYAVSISAPGFRPTEAPSVVVSVSETAVLDQSLAVGGATEQVTVTANAAEALQTETSTLGGVVSPTEVVGLPLVTRNVQQIMTLSPGAEMGVMDGTSLGRGSLPINVNGQMDTSNSYQEDGVNVSDYGNSANEEANSFYGSIPVPSPDAIQEFKVQTSNYDASYGRNSGGAVDMVTKSGTNKWHGNLFEFLRNDDLNANEFFEKREGNPRGALKQNQFGGTLGGPVVRDRLFFFFSYQGTRQVNAVSPSSTSSTNLPSQLTNNRTAAALGAAFCPANNPVGNPGALYAYTYSPTGGTNPASDQVACDGSNINSVALKLLNTNLPSGQQVIPTPRTILNAGTANAVGFTFNSIPSSFSEDQGNFNLDYTISSSNSLALKYFYSYGLAQVAFNNEEASAVEPYSGGQTRYTGNNLIIGTLTSVLRSNLVNQLHISDYYIRAYQASDVPFTAEGFGITPAQNFYPEIPPITITGVTGILGQGNDAASNPTITYEVGDQLSWSRGRHTIRFGYDQQYVHWNFCSCGKSRGSLTFQSWADFLLGESAAQNGTTLSNVYAVSASGQSFNNPNLGRENQASAFVQDDYKVNARLTLNLGLRWEYDGTPYDVNPTHGGTNIDYSLLAAQPIPPASGTLVGYNVAHNYTGTLPPGVFRRAYDTMAYVRSAFDDFAPRFGLAWEPFGNRLVVHGGFGMFYQVNDGQHELDAFDSNPPLSAAISLNGTGASLATFAVPFNPPATPAFGSFYRTTTSHLSYTAVAPNLFVPFTAAWNLDIQYAIRPSLIADLIYVGNRSPHVNAGYYLNYPSLATPTNPLNCGAPTGCITSNTAANAAQRVPIVGASLGGFFMQAANAGDAHYNGVEAQLKQNVTHGLMFQAGYTFGGCMTDISGVSLTSQSLRSFDPATYSVSTPNGLNAQRADCGWNRSQRFIASYMYQFPNVHSSHYVVRTALSGWMASGVTTIQSGQNMTITDPLLGGAYGSTGSIGAQSCPGITIKQMKTPGGVEKNLNNYLNLSAFADTSATKGLASCPQPIVGAFPSPGSGLPASPGATGYGNLRQNIVPGPGQDNWDISLDKTTQIVRENSILEFRADFFNAFNHAQFSNPLTLTTTSGAFGEISSTSTGPRILQFSLKYRF